MQINREDRRQEMKKQVLTSMLVLGLLLALGVGWTQAQEPDEEGEIATQGEFGIAAITPGAIAVQGRLTDSSGNPLSDGDYSVTFRLYEQETGGGFICWDNNTVTVEDGLFNTYMDGCYDDLYGQKVWLGVEVESDGEMTDRQVIYPVPYALSLRPGAVISATHDNVLTVRSRNADALIVESGDGGEAVEAHATGSGDGIWVRSQGAIALNAHSYDTSSYPGVYGCSASDQSTCANHKDDGGAAGVSGYSSTDFAGHFVSGSTADGGVYGEATYSLGVGVWGENTGGGMALYGETDSTGHLQPTLYLVQHNDTSSGNFVVGADRLGGDRLWRIDGTGKGFFDGGTQTGGADFAEQMEVRGKESDYVPGDVLVISTSADRMVKLSAEPFDTAVIGVYSTEPGVLAGAPDTDDPLAGIPVAITGIVPCKVSAENGAIHRGDLLTTSSTPGHAMLCDDPSACIGAIVGKALGELEEGTGFIEILVTLQ
jgi:hypothetical protein